MSRFSVEGIRGTIRKIETETPRFNKLIPGRYPYTYAYDYMRSHAREFGVDAASRADCAGLLSKNPDKDLILYLLADAFIREHNIIDTGEDRVQT